jgi:elongation factor G
MAVYAAKKGDEEKIFNGLHRLNEEDICFEIKKDQETGETLLVGIGETQLGVLVKKLKNKYGGEAELRTPKIAYRETIKKTVQAEGKHKKQSGGAGQYGHCWMRFEPYYEGDFLFDEEVVGGTVPKQYIPAVEKGIRQAILKGVLAGYPMVNLKAVVFDGSSHPVDSKEIAYVMAANIAYKEGIPKAGPVLLEPIETLKITVPDNYLGDILGDLNRRRGRILGTDNAEGRQVVSAEAPLSEIQKYATDLRSMTQGRGSYTMEHNRYEEVPPVNAQKIIAEAAKEASQE